MCKVPEDILAQAEKINPFVKVPLSTPIPEPKMPMVKSEPVPNEYAAAKVGDYITFGRYKQEGQMPQDIEWRVLAKEGNKILVISRYGLDCQRYHQTCVPQDLVQN